jgi:1,4-dihydroxy-2-naphthoate octaprenyltransferase
MRPSRAKAWWLAIRPKTLPAAVGPVAVGTAVAALEGGARWLPALAALLGAVWIQIGTNLANDYFDFIKGADTAERLGPARATQQGWVSPRAMAWATAAAFGVAALFGAYLVAVGGWPIVWIGVASIVSGVLYTGGPAPLGYLGLGDVFVFVFFGPVAVAGTTYVQTGGWSRTALLASVPLGLLSTAILVVNNLRDARTDVRAGKRTLVVRFGERFGRVEYASLVAGAFAVAVVGWAMSTHGLLGGSLQGAVAQPGAITGGVGWLAPLALLPLAIAGLRRVMGADGAALNPELGATARLGLLYSLALTAGLVGGGLWWPSG